MVIGGDNTENGNNVNDGGSDGSNGGGIIFRAAMQRMRSMSENGMDEQMRGTLLVVSKNNLTQFVKTCNHI